MAGGNVVINASPEAARPFGVEIDGAVYGLQGQPPLAKGKPSWPPTKRGDLGGS